MVKVLVGLIARGPTCLGILVLLLADTRLGAQAVRAVAAEVVSSSQCTWEGWLPPEAGRTRFRAAHALTSTSESAFRRQLSSPDAHVRDAAARSLAAGHDSSTVNVLLASLEDASAIVRDGALRSLGRIGSARAVPALIPALADSSKHIRQASAWSLGQLQQRAAVAPLLSASHDRQEHVRAEAAWALGFIGEASALSRLCELATDTVKAVRVAATCAVGWLSRDVTFGSVRNRCG